MSTMTVAPQPTALRVLDAHDRCDRCGAPLAVAVHDERGRLTA